MTETPQPPQPQPAPVPGAPQAPQAPAVRPGGLTALAVLNFVFGGLGVIGLIIAFGALALASKITADLTSAGVTVTKGPGLGTAWLLIILSLIVVGLLIVSAIGYVTQKKVAGYVLGCAYGIVGAVSNILTMALTGFGILSLLMLVYAVLTLILLNTTYKKCFVN